MKFRAVVLVAATVLLGSPSSHADGTRTHAEIGMMCVEKYLLDADPMLPGLGTMFKDQEIRRILCGGCGFSDWGFGGVNPEAGEASHWHPFESAWAGVLKDRHYTMPPTEAARKEMAFFMGALCHNIADLPWHFRHGKDLSFLNMAAQMDGASHIEAETGMDLAWYIRKARGHVEMPSSWVPYDTIMGVMRRAKVNATEQQLRTGVSREHLILRSGPFASQLLANNYHPKLAWSTAHVMDYYYGGMEHAAASSAMWCRYWYADIMGGYCLQQMPRYFDEVAKGSRYVPYLGTADTTLRERLPTNNAGQEPILEAGGPTGNRRSILIRFGLADVPKDAKVGKATLWLACAGPVDGDSGPVPLAVYPAPAAWREGAGVSDPCNGVAGRAAVTGEATWSTFPAECGSPTAQTSLQKTAQHQWVSFDVTTLVSSWIKDPGANNGFMIRSTSDATAKFFSAQAFQATPDGYCGGTRVAYRPMLIILP